ncbi:hypothetical protein J3Q64DRAFT_1255623 [Phycomyces blakesleeanus]|uniref:Uncharacterized protein n=1 Tax=Phycomyces blakesleeanus TaxID=4837 RepID=A0ABR3ARA5_PHYBL
MSTGHVIYACNCLNIKLHLANKYILQGHEMARKEYFVRLNTPPIEGWKFELGMGGVVTECNALVRTKIVGHGDAMTVSCLNCATGEVYTILKPDDPNCQSYPADPQALSQHGEALIVHTGTVFGPAVDTLKKKSNYSKVFNIVLSSDLPFTEDDKPEGHIPSELYRHHKTFAQKLETSLELQKQDTEARIEKFKREQYNILSQTTNKAKYEWNVLWQRMNEASKTVNEEDRLERRKSRLDDSNSHASDNSFWKKINEGEAAVKPAGQEGDSSLSKSQDTKSTSHVRFADKEIPAQHSSSFRRSTFVLDENRITSSVKKSSNLSNTIEMHPDKQDIWEDASGKDRTGHIFQGK